jgi:hypothetical protein
MPLTHARVVKLEKRNPGIVRTEKKTREAIEKHEAALAQVETSLARKGDEEVKGDAKTRLKLSADYHKEVIADLKKLAGHYAATEKKGGKGTRRKRRSAKKWTSSATRKRSSMSASMGRRGRK